jgi:prefoldin alpha subunit
MSEAQAQQLIQQMQMLENMYAELSQKESSIGNIIRDANSAIKSIQEIKANPDSESLVPIGMGTFIKTKNIPNEKVVVNVGAGVAIEKEHDSALNYLESKIKELEVALQETNTQRQQIAANLEQGKQQMQQIMQQPQNKPQ